MTPLRYLLSVGASKDIKTDDGERPLDLCDARDFGVISVMLESEKSRKAKLSMTEEEDDFDDFENNNDDDDDSSKHKDVFKDDNSRSKSIEDLSSSTQTLSLGKPPSKNSNNYLNRPPKPPGHSILKKTPQTFSPVVE